MMNLTFEGRIGRPERLGRTAGGAKGYLKAVPVAVLVSSMPAYRVYSLRWRDTVAIFNSWLSLGWPFRIRTDGDAISMVTIS